MDPLDLVKLTALMERTSGSPEVKIGLIDGPVVTQHPDLAGEHLREIPGSNGATCTQANSTACLHGTFVAGILSAKRNSPAPAICPNCTLLVRPIFAEATSGREHMPSATPKELAAAIIECIDAGARVINLSLALAQPSTKGEQSLEEALNQAVRRGVIVVAAAGNQGTLGSSAITRHPWVIPVVACDLRGRPMNESNLGSSIGRRGLTRTRRWHHQPGRRRTIAHARRNERGRAICDRRDCAAVVGISLCDRGAHQARHHPGIHTAAGLGGSAIAGCRGGLPSPARQRMRGGE